MSDPSARAQDSWTSDSIAPAIEPSGSARPTPTDAESLPATSPASPSTPTSPNSTQPSSSLSIASSEGRPARTGLTPGSKPGSAASEPVCSGTSLESATDSDHDGRFGRTSPECSPLTEAETLLSSWEPSWAPWSLFPQEAGFARVWQLDPLAVRLGGCSTLNGSECPSGAGGCSLSLILEVFAPSRFYLSAKAAAGILRRAEKRGRKLPGALERALLALSGSPTATRQTLNEGGVFVRRSDASTERGGASMTTTPERDTLSLPRPSVVEAIPVLTLLDGDGRTTPISSHSNPTHTHTHTRPVDALRAEEDVLTASRTPLSFHATQTPISDPDVAPSLGVNGQIGVLIDE